MGVVFAHYQAIEERYFTNLLDLLSKPDASIRGIEWSLRASASMRALCLFLRAREFGKFFLRATSTLESRKPAAPMKYDKG